MFGFTILLIVYALVIGYITTEWWYVPFLSAKCFGSMILHSFLTVIFAMIFNCLDD